MKLLISLKTGFKRSLESWKGVTVIWLFSLLLVSVVVIPMKRALLTGLGNSMITEKLANGINIDVFADLGAILGSLSSYFTSGILLALIIGFFINSFLTGGLFNSLKRLQGNFSSEEFFRASARNFLSFTLISLIINIISLFLAILIIIIPVLIAFNSEASTEGTLVRTAILFAPVFFLALNLLFLIADYARAWQVTHNSNACFKSLHFGFRQTFRTFLLSYPLILMLFLVQLFFGWLVLSILPGIMPATEWGIVLLFILSQFLIFLKIFIKTLRYGSVTRMMELTT